MRHDPRKRDKSVQWTDLSAERRELKQAAGCIRPKRKAEPRCLSLGLSQRHGKQINRSFNRDLYFYFNPKQALGESRTAYEN
jgi:hypothetical protein